jgi:hypothetical protein
LPLRLLSPDESMDCRTGENSVHSTYVLQVLLARETAESDGSNLRSSILWIVRPGRLLLCSPLNLDGEFCQGHSRRIAF